VQPENTTPVPETKSPTTTKTPSAVINVDQYAANTVYAQGFVQVSEQTMGTIGPVSTFAAVWYACHSNSLLVAAV
jgi:hypothetical protein